jgi:LysM repeat protein
VFHTVAPGEVLWQIALKHGVSVHELIRANNLLNPNWLIPGQALYLPYPVSPRYEATVVRSGDTLAKIAVQFGTNSANLQKINKLPTISTDLRIGQTLYVSRGPEAWLDAGGSYQTYAVQPGDTYWSIALRAGTTVSDLLKVNRLSYPAPLYAGDILLVRSW